MGKDCKGEGSGGLVRVGNECKAEDSGAMGSGVGEEWAEGLEKGYRSSTEGRGGVRCEMGRSGGWDSGQDGVGKG